MTTKKDMQNPRGTDYEHRKAPQPKAHPTEEDDREPYEYLGDTAGPSPLPPKLNYYCSNCAPENCLVKQSRVKPVVCPCDPDWKAPWLSHTPAQPTGAQGRIDAMNELVVAIENRFSEVKHRERYDLVLETIRGVKDALLQVGRK